MNSRENYAAGAVLSFSYAFMEFFAAGLTFTASSNFSYFYVIEPTVFFRWYFFNGDIGDFFVQADAGAYVFFDYGYITPLFDGGLRGGVRIPLGSIFYLEPYGRIGYPFAFGIGVISGVKFWR